MRTTCFGDWGGVGTSFGQLRQHLVPSATIPQASIPQAQLNKYILATQQEFSPKHVINYYNCLMFSKMKMSLKPKPYILTF